MNKYRIYCTEEQTKKALELGAPIIKATYQNKEPHVGVLVKLINKETIYDYICPSAEEMIGWLEEQGVSVEITMASRNIGYYSLNRIDNKGSFDFTGRCEETYSSRKEATLAAIDAALDFI